MHIKRFLIYAPWYIKMALVKGNYSFYQRNGAAGPIFMDRQHLFADAQLDTFIHGVADFDFGLFGEFLLGGHFCFFFHQLIDFL